MIYFRIASEISYRKRREGMCLCEWKEAVQAMIDWLEENLTENPSLLDMSKQVGYSPYYCSTQFHEIVGMTLKSYIAGRKLAKAAIEIRDTKERILDIAIKYGYSSQEALTRAFHNAYGCTPAAYRRKNCPLMLSIRQVVLEPYDIEKGEIDMGKTCLTDAQVKIEYIPEHQYLGIWDENSSDYGSFWKHHNCDEVCGIIDSLSHFSDPIVGPHMPGWFLKDGERKYFYGMGVPMDYTGPIPEGFELKKIPGSYYAVFFHPAFDYLQDNNAVMNRVENMAWNYDISKLGSSEMKYDWNGEAPSSYQRHYPEVRGYEICRPIKRI